MAVMAGTMRLDKFLSGAGCGTRSQVKDFLRKGRVTVDGEAVRKPETRVTEGVSSVCLDGRPVRYVSYEYYMLNKPAGVVSATEDRREQTVLDLLPPSPCRDLFPVGRLDKDTTGLLLVCNDGELAHELLSPRKHVEKVYEVITDGSVSEETVRLFEQGLQVDAEWKALPARLEITGENASRVTLQEGKFHQVKRMYAAVGLKVMKLKRISMGPLSLDPALAPGESRKLTDEEVALLKNLQERRNTYG